jgi:dTDP-4-dehydrorhamnose 3,5-epimerase
MFREGPIDDVVIRALKPYHDARGWLIELFRNDELPDDNWPTMAYVSATEPGVARGPHEHVDQSDYFAFVGPGDFKLYLWDSRESAATYQNRMTIVVGESNPQAVIVPPGVVHAYKNVSPAAGWVFNCPNRLYAGQGRKEKVDEIRHENQETSPYQLD